MITTRGVGFLTAAILGFVLARLTQVGWLYLMDALLWGVIILSVVPPWFGVVRLGARRKLERPNPSSSGPGPSEGDSIRIELSLRNRAFWPRFFLNAIYDCPLADPAQRLRRFFVAKLDGSGHVSMTSTIEAFQRGLHHLGPVVVESALPFGLFRRRVSLAAPLPVLVYPRVYPLRRMALLQGLRGMAAQPLKSRLGPETVGSRHYFPGDPRRFIHWRNTARLGRPMVKEFEDPPEQTLCLLFDAGQLWGQGRETSLEYSIKVVASVANYALCHRASVRVWGGRLQASAFRSPGSSGGLWQDLLKGLALVAAGEGPGLAQTLRQVPPGSSVLIVVSAADTDGIWAILRAAPIIHGLVVVALKGFGEPETNGEDLDALERARIPLVRCRAGQLPKALQELEQLGDPLADKMGAALVKSI